MKKWISVIRRLSLLKGGGVLAMFLVCTSSVFSQDFEWTITTTGGEHLRRVALDRVTADSLVVVNSKGRTDWVFLDSIATVRHARRSAILPATLIGAAGGGVLGIVLKPVAKDQQEADLYSAAFGVVIGGVAGYLTGSLAQSDEVMDFRLMDRNARRDALRRAMQ